MAEQRSIPSIYELKRAATFHLASSTTDSRRRDVRFQKSNYPTNKLGLIDLSHHSSPSKEIFNSNRIADDKIRNDLKATKSAKRYAVDINNNNFEPKPAINLPKTTANKKGALTLGPGDQPSYLSSTNIKKNLTFSIQPSSNNSNTQRLNEAFNNLTNYGSLTKSNNELKQTGLRREKTIAHLESMDRRGGGPNMTSSRRYVEPVTTLSTQNLLSSLDAKLSNSTNEPMSGDKVATNGPEEARMKTINRGFSAKRYLRVLTKNWDQSLLDKFISDGKIKPESVYEKNSNNKSYKRKLAEDDLSMWPQSYRFDPSWTQSTVDMRSYKFLRVQEYGPNSRSSRKKAAVKSRTKVPTVGLIHDEDENDPYGSDNDDMMVKHQFSKIDPIKIYDENANEINYKNLNLEQKEEVLAELLFHSVLNNLKSQRTTEFQYEKLSHSPEKKTTEFTRVQVSANNQEKVEKVVHVRNFPQELGNNQAPSTARINEVEQNNEAVEATGEVNHSQRENKSVDIKKRAVETAAATPTPTMTASNSKHPLSEPIEPIYMFGKYSGAPWVIKKLQNETPKSSRGAVVQQEPLIHQQPPNTEETKNAAAALLMTPKPTTLSQKIVTPNLQLIDKSVNESSSVAPQPVIRKKLTRKDAIIHPAGAAQTPTASKTNEGVRIMIGDADESAPTIQSGTRQIRSSRSPHTPNIHFDELKRVNTTPNRSTKKGNDVDLNSSQLLLPGAAEPPRTGSRFNSVLHIYEDDEKPTTVGFYMEQIESDLNEIDSTPTAEVLLIKSESQGLAGQEKVEVHSVSFAKKTQESEVKNVASRVEPRLDEVIKHRETRPAVKERWSETIQKTKDVEKKATPQINRQSNELPARNELKIDDFLKMKEQEGERVGYNFLANREPAKVKKISSPKASVRSDSRPRLADSSSKLNSDSIHDMSHYLKDYENQFKPSGFTGALTTQRPVSSKSHHQTTSSPMRQTDQQPTVTTTSTYLIQREPSSISNNFKKTSMENLPSLDTESNKIAQNSQTPSLPKLNQTTTMPSSINKKQQTVIKPMATASTRVVSFDVADQLKDDSQMSFDADYAYVDSIKLKSKPSSQNQSDKLRRKIGIETSTQLLQSSTRQAQNLSAKMNAFVKERTPLQASTEYQANNNQVRQIYGKDWPRGDLPGDPRDVKIRGYMGGLEATEAPKKKPVSLDKKSIKKDPNWSVGGFDPREFFTSWSYEPAFVPVLIVDKTFADLLKKYAQFIAKIVLKKKLAGVCLSQDVKKALEENMARLRDSIAQGQISRELIDEYKKIFKQIFAKALKIRNLNDIEIDDETFMYLLEFPAHAFELVFDQSIGKERLRVKSAYMREYAKLVRLVVTEKNLDLDDFQVEVDPNTGQMVYKLKKDVARMLGIPEGYEDIIEMFIDEHGRQMMRFKNGLNRMTIGDTLYELIVDPNTGKQLLRMTTKQKVGEESLDDILRLAENMSPEARNRYFQELLKTSGGKMSDEMRQRIIDEMFKNVNNLSEEAREQFLKDVMVNLVNELPPDMAKKMLAEIMKSTDKLDPSIKEKMIKELLNNMDALPEDLQESTLKELIKNMDSLPSDVKHKLLQDILAKVEENGGSEIDKEIRNQVLKEMLRNAENLDEESRQKIIQQVLDKFSKDGGDGQLPQNILEELVKHMDQLPAEMKQRIIEEVQKSLEKGDMDASVLAQLLQNADQLPPEILADIVRNSDKMDSDTLRELVKNLDKLPDDLKEEMINKMVNNLSELDSSVQQQFLKELLTNPNLIKDEAQREQLIKQIMQKLTPEDVLAQIADMSPEDKNRYLQDLLKRAGDMSDETRQAILDALLKNAENLDQETRDNLLRDLVGNLIKDLPPDIAAKVLADLMKSTENLDAETKQRMMENLLNNMDDLPDHIKQQTLQEMMKNLDDLDPEKKEELFKNILNNIDQLPSELRDQALKTLIENMDNLSADAKNQLLQDVLERVEQEGGDSEFSRNLRNEIIKEMIANAKDLDEESRKKLLQDVMDKYQGEDLPSNVLSELMKQMDDLPDHIKQTVLNELKKNIESGKIDSNVLEQLMKNADSLPRDLLEKVIENISQLAPDALAKLIKNLDSLPDDLKKKAVQDMLKNLEGMDANAQKELLLGLINNPGLLDNPADREKAILNIMENLKNVPEEVKRDMLKNIAKNIQNMSKEAKEKIMNQIFDNMQTSSDETREEILKQLLKKMGQKELEEWIKNSDMSEEFKQKMLADLNKIMENEDNLLDSDDEAELEGLTGEERERRKRQLIKKKKEELEELDKKHEEATRKLDPAPKRDPAKRNYDWLQEKKKDIFKKINIDPDNPTDLNLDEDQIDFLKAFDKLSKEEREKMLENMSEEEKSMFMKMQDEFKRLKQKELEEAIEEAKRVSLEKLRQKLEMEKKMAYIKFLKLESRLLEHNQKLSRAFVFSYVDAVQWLDATA